MLIEGVTPNITQVQALLRRMKLEIAATKYEIETDFPGIKKVN